MNHRPSSNGVRRCVSCVHALYNASFSVTVCCLLVFSPMPSWTYFYCVIPFPSSPFSNTLALLRLRNQRSWAKEPKSLQTNTHTHTPHFLASIYPKLLTRVFCLTACQGWCCHPERCQKSRKSLLPLSGERMDEKLRRTQGRAGFIKY